MPMGSYPAWIGFKSPEDVLPGEEEMCGRLNFSMYGTRDAAVNWADEYSSRLISMGFKQGKATPCAFYLRQRGLRAYVHGDDFVVSGLPTQLKWMRERLEDKYQLTVKVLGPEEGQSQEVRVLNRVLRWKDAEGVEYEVDPRHVEIMIKQLECCQSCVWCSITVKQCSSESCFLKFDLTNFV